MPRPMPLKEPVTMATLLVDLYSHDNHVLGDEGFLDVAQALHFTKNLSIFINTNLQVNTFKTKLIIKTLTS